MAYSNVNVFSEYLGNGVDTTFNVTFDIIDNDASAIRAKVYDESSVSTESRLLNAGDIAQKYIQLAELPTDPSLVEVSVLGSPTVYVNGVDFQCASDIIVWGGFPLEGDINAGNTLVINYNTSSGEVTPQPIPDGGGTYDYTVDTGTPSITLNNPLPSGYRLIIYRESTDNSPVSYNDFRFPYETATRDFDRLYHAVQENRKALENAGLNEYYRAPDAQGSPIYNIITNIISTAAAIDVVPVADTAYTATNGQLVVMTAVSGTTTINLPASHAEGDTVRVNEVGGSMGTSTKTVSGNGSTIVGEGASYSFVSDYESKVFISDGTQWYIS